MHPENLPMSHTVIPANAGAEVDRRSIQTHSGKGADFDARAEFPASVCLDSRVRGNDEADQTKVIAL